MEALMLFADVFSDVPDPRDCTARHELVDILFVALAAVLCGATHCTEFYLFAQGRLELLRQFVPLKHGVPSHDTFSRVLAAVEPKAFEAALRRFMKAFGEQAGLDVPTRQVALDGKALRRAYAKGAAHMPPLLVSLFSCDSFMSLASVAAAKGGEAQAAIEAVKLLSLKGLTVTGDALHCHRRMTRAIRQQGGHYILTIKGNQSKLAKAAAEALDRAAVRAKTVFYESEANAHGRHERRRAFVTSFTQAPGNNQLIDLKAVARIETWRTVGEKTTYRVRNFALSKKWAADELAALVRNHWQIENNLHWQLDVLLHEDELRGRKQNLAANQGVLRRMALNILRAEPQTIPMRHKQLKARWSDQDFIKLCTYVR
jgi:predicted transposase YbfD/YdcC